MRMSNRICVFCTLAACLFAVTYPWAQTAENADAGLPSSTRWLLDAAGEKQRSAIKSVYMIICEKQNSKGTGFLIANGMIVTDNHVVEGCAATELRALSASGATIRFLRMATDADRDLALLKPAMPITGGLTLASDISPDVGATVTTWGYPLIYNGPAPLLSVGYVAGFDSAVSHGKTIKHIVVNGAFNPGNSGGPLLLHGTDKVVGVVVWKMLILPQWTKAYITGLGNASAKVCCAVTLDLQMVRHVVCPMMRRSPLC